MSNKKGIMILMIGSIMLIGCTHFTDNKAGSSKSIYPSPTAEVTHVPEQRIQNISVQQRIGDEATFSISDQSQIQMVKEILDSIIWINAEVSMARPPDYSFVLHFEKNKSPQYMLWISPNKDKVELVVAGASQYIQLDEEHSSTLFEILTGQSLLEASELLTTSDENKRRILQ